MNKQQKNYIKAVVGFVLAAIILCAGIMTALYLMREEKGMENLMAPVLKRLIAGILLFGLTVCWRHFLKKSVSKVAGIIAIVLLSLFFAWHNFWNSAGKSIKTAECESGKSRISWV